MILLAFIDCWPCPCQASLQREREIEADNAVVAVLAEAYRCCPSAAPPYSCSSPPPLAAACRLSCRDLIIWPLFLFATSDNLHSIFILLIYICLLFLFLTTLTSTLLSTLPSLLYLCCFFPPPGRVICIPNWANKRYDMHTHFKWFINHAKDIHYYTVTQITRGEGQRSRGKMNMLNIIKNAYA